MSAYCTAKAGVEMFTRVAAMELAPHNIRVTAIGPGVIDTPLTAPLMGIPGIRDEYVENIPAGRVGTPDDIAAAVTANHRRNVVGGEVKRGVTRVNAGIEYRDTYGAIRSPRVGFLVELAETNNRAEWQRDRPRLRPRDLRDWHVGQRNLLVSSDHVRIEVAAGTTVVLTLTHDVSLGDLAVEVWFPGQPRRLIAGRALRVSREVRTLRLPDAGTYLIVVYAAEGTIGATQVSYQLEIQEETSS